MSRVLFELFYLFFFWGGGGGNAPLISTSKPIKARSLKIFMWFPSSNIHSYLISIIYSLHTYIKQPFSKGAFKKTSRICIV